MPPIARLSVDAQHASDPNCLPSLFEITASAALLSGTNREAIAGLIHLIDAGAIPRDIHHPDLTPGEGWAHYLARFGQEAEQGENTLSLADRFRALTDADIALDDVQHRTPLVLAVQAGNVAAINALIEAGAHRDFADATGRTPLHHAVICGAPAPVLSALLAKGPAIEQADHGGQTALELAVLTNNEQAVEVLLAEGAGRGERDQAIGSLQAASPEHPYLKRKRGERDQAVGPLQGREAAFGDRTRQMGQMGQMGHAVRPRYTPGNTLLTHRAAMSGQTRIVELLVQAGWPIDAPDRCGGTALHHATEGLHLDTMRALLAAGASVDSRNDKSRTPLLWLLNTLSQIRANTPPPDDSQIVAAINTLIRARASVNAIPLMEVIYRQDNILIAGRTPLHWAVAHRHLPSIQALLESGADPKLKSSLNQTPQALAGNDPDICALFDQFASHAP